MWANPALFGYNSPNTPLGVDKPSQGDFEFWSPSEEREEQCLFGRQVC